MCDYSDIINMQRPKHINDDFSIKYPKMSRENRAKIFSPFSPLKSYSKMRAEREKVTLRKKELTEEEVRIINEELHKIDKMLAKRQKPKVSVTYFVPDAIHPYEGTYETVTSCVQKLYLADSVLKLEDIQIEFRYISTLKTENT